jgi:transcription initiation factor TFIIIB Brf1 subunit/transcription initiation factor TFIIB
MSTAIPPPHLLFKTSKQLLADASTPRALKEALGACSVFFPSPGGYPEKGSSKCSTGPITRTYQVGGGGTVDVQLRSSGKPQAWRKPKKNPVSPVIPEEPVVDDWSKLFADVDTAEVEISTPGGHLVGLRDHTIQVVDVQAVGRLGVQNAVTCGRSVDLSLTSELAPDSALENHSSCGECGGTLQRDSCRVVCLGCGAESQSNTGYGGENVSMSVLSECNVRAEGFLAHKFVGRGSYRCQRALLRTCAKYSHWSSASVLKELRQKSAQSQRYHLPKDVITAANDMYNTIKSYNYVFRKNIKQGVLSACVYYACYEAGISKTPSEVAAIFDIEDRFHSIGDRTLADLNSLGIIQLPGVLNPIRQYVRRYLGLLKIDGAHEDFVLELINTAERFNLHVRYDTKPSTKAVGALWMLISRIPALRDRIGKDTVSTQCKISPTTFVKYYKMLCMFHGILRPVFKRHQVPMMAEWRRD